MKTKDNSRGAVSIFLVIILVPMLTVSSLFVDASKLQLAKGVAESAGDLTLNTALTDYDTMLKDMYGLFATAQDTSELYDLLEDYYRTCITSSGVSNEDADVFVSQIMNELKSTTDEDVSDILNMQLIDFSVTKDKERTLANPSILKKQIVDFMKYRSPINTGLSFITALQNFSTLSEQTDLVDKRQSYYEEQEEVMKSAQKAWEFIEKYNQSGFVTSETYFSDMKNMFNGYQKQYENIATKIIKDLYDTQAYANFNNYNSIVYEEIEIEAGITEKVPIYYTNAKKTEKKKNYTEYSTYSSSKVPTSENIKSALNEFKKAYDEVEKRKSKLLPYSNTTYGLQYLAQTNRQNLYKDWTAGVSKLYERYSELRHAVYVVESSGNSVLMSTSDKMFGESSSHPYSYYYKKCLDQFDKIAEFYSSYSSTLEKFSQNVDTSTSETESQITNLYTQISGYRTTISDAKSNLETAVKHLQDVYKKINDGGDLQKKKDEWKKAASKESLSNTSMAKQDLAEIKNLSSYLKPGDVEKLITRLNNVIGHLNDLINQIDSYTFFGTKIAEIDSYNTFTYVLKSKIGDDNLKNVPTDTNKLNDQISNWIKGQFIIGNNVNVSWNNKSGHQANLTKDKPNFYSYLYTHFHSSSSNSSKDNAESIYDKYKQNTSGEANKNATSASKGNSEIKNEIHSSNSDLPSNISKNKGETPSASIATGDDAAKKTSKSLFGMFDNLLDSVSHMGTDLRDKLYVADYIISMFSYDTIEKEAKHDQSNKKNTIQTLTLMPIDAQHNCAYTKEVEYIIYGGKNSSNISKAYGTIYGIRLAFNSIYAFTDSSIRDTAFAIATPLSAATMGVIPAPLIQTAIIFGAACCESGNDLANLKNGESVPLFKNNQTWTCSLSGLFQDVSSDISAVIKDGVEAGIDSGIEQINNLLDMSDEELTEYIKGKEDSLSNSISASFDTIIIRHANTAIQKLTTLCNNAIEEKILDPNLDMTKMVSEGLDEWLVEEASNTDPSSDLSYIVKKEAVNIIKTTYITQLLTQLEKNNDSAQDSISNATQSLSNIIGSIRTNIIINFQTGNNSVILYKENMKKKIRTAMNDSAHSLKEVLNDEINNIFGSKNSYKNSDNTGVSSLLSFSYSDYLRLFLMVGLYTSEDSILLRTADVIQTNVGFQTNSDDYRLSNSAVYVNLNATLQVKPTLLALPLFSKVSNNPINNEKWYTIELNLVKGY